MCDLEKYEASTEDHSVSPILPSDNDAIHFSANNKNNPTRTVFYWIVLVLVLFFLVFFTGSVFSCRAFYYSDYDDSYAYGYRGLIHNTTGECISWEDYNGTGSYWLILMSMGIAGVILSAFALGIWILEGTYGIGSTITNESSTTAVSSTSTPSRRSCCVCLVIPTIFGIVLGVFGVLAFATLMGSCSLTGLDPDGLECYFSVWSSLGMFASIAACILGCSVCCAYRRSS